MRKKEILPVSEKRFRFMLVLTGIVVLISVFSIIDKFSSIVTISIITIFLTTISSPQRYLDSIGDSILGRRGLLLGLITALLFAGYIALERADYLIAASFVYLLFSAILFIFFLQQTARARSDRKNL